MSRAGFQETAQRVHDYGRLVERWGRIARGAGLELETFAHAGEYPLHCLRTHGDLDGGFYVSAGIHGDEPAGPEALALWAQTHLSRHVRARGASPLLILPCLNPWGLVHNQRTDAQGRDLNRMFNRRVSPIREIKQLIAGHRFALGLALHEDYDGRGIYLYEITESPPGIGAGLLRACRSSKLPIDPRRQIEDLPFKQGLLGASVVVEDVPFVPEALWMYPGSTPHFLTFETPSEFSLERRVRAHLRLIEACVSHLSAARR